MSDVRVRASSALTARHAIRPRDHLRFIELDHTSKADLFGWFRITCARALGTSGRQPMEEMKISTSPNFSRYMTPT